MRSAGAVFPPDHCPFVGTPDTKLLGLYDSAWEGCVIKSALCLDGDKSTGTRRCTQVTGLDRPLKSE